MGLAHKSSNTTLGRYRPCDSLDLTGTNDDNGVMVITGHVQNGVVVLEGDVALPEGAAVVVSYSALTTMSPAGKDRRIQTPLVRTGQPGSVNLTGRRIAEILDEEDAASRR